MSNTTQQTAESTIESIDPTTVETLDATEDTAVKGASGHKIEKAVAGIPDAISDFVHKNGEGVESDHKIEKAVAGIPGAISDLVHKEGEEGRLVSEHRVEKAVAGIPGALTALKEKELAEDAEKIESEGVGVVAGHKLEKIVAGSPDQVEAIKDEVADHVKPVIEQSSAEAKARSKAIGTGAVMILAAIVIAAFGIPIILLGIAAALALVLPWWASLLIVGGVLLVAACVCTLMAKSRFSKAGEYDVGLKAGIRKSFEYFFKGIGMPEDMAEKLRETDK